jgi:hypothetical protein
MKCVDVERLDQVIATQGSSVETLSALSGRAVRLGAQDYWIDSDTSILQTAPTGTDTWTPVSPSQHFFHGRIALADGYDLTAGPVVAHDPESIFVVGPIGDPEENLGYSISRVTIADGQVLWKTEAQDARSVDALASAGGVLALVVRVTPWAANPEDQAPIHARAFGVDLGSGVSSWTLDI